MNGDLVVLRPEGLYCPQGDFHIDPWRAVPRAVITHAHADHARRGHGAFLCAARGAGLLRQRLGNVSLQPLAYAEALAIGPVRVSLHPAGHVLGSAQVRLEHQGRVWVVSGDYFVSGDHGCLNPTCEPFEPQRCEVFVTESTFALPVYRWPRQGDVMASINAWWRANADAGVPSVLRAYSLGKAQRLLADLDPEVGPIVVHATVDAIDRVYRDEGVALPATRRLDDGLDAGSRRRAIAVLPPGTAADALGPERREAFASGWMQLRARRRSAAGGGFVLSDHADWPGLQQAIAATGAGRVIVTHGFEAAMIRWLQGRGIQASSFETALGDTEATERR